MPPAMARDFYEVLGVPRDADEKAIRSAYRRLAKEHHPDRNKDDPESAKKLKEVNAAYEVLGKADKRAAYDRMGHAAFGQAAMGGGPAPQGFPGGFQEFSGSFADIFEEMFGSMTGARPGGRAQGPARGADVQYRVEVSLEDAFTGTEQRIRYPVRATCETCGGTGAEGGAGGAITCETCGGRGRIRHQQGFFTIERTCPACGGTGKVIKNPCKACGGAGQVERTKSLTVKIPAGIESGQRIRLSGEGEGGARGGRAGDLFVLVAVRPHDTFRREGANLYTRLPITITTAALGGAARVPTIDGKPESIKIPAGAQTGQRLRLRGKGMGIVGRPVTRGDLFVDLFVETPVNLTARQQALLRDLAKTLGDGGAGAHSPQSSGFMGKVKQMWDDLTD
jgi:molecular chaperone DnaJ